MKLTDTQIKNFKPSGKTQKLADGGGLYLHISLSGSKLWRMAYRFDGKQKTLSFGVYPYITLKEAREQREAAKELLAHGVDPGEHKKAVKQAKQAESESSYEVIAREWLSSFFNTKTDKHRQKVESRQEKDIFPAIGHCRIDEITPSELLQVIRGIEARGALYTAHRVLQECGQVFRYAIATGRASRDISSDLRGAIPPARQKNMATIVQPEKVGELLRAIDGYGGSIIVAFALKLAPLLFVRPGELRHAEWSEFNFKDNEWRIPANKMKMRQIHIVPLAKQSLAILQSLQAYTGHGRYLFPSPLTNNRPISDMALLTALRRMGFTKDEMVVHGFRSMASTLLNELGYNRDWIERQMAHSERNKVRATYNYAEYLPERRKMMQAWANYLDGLKANIGN